MRASLSLGFLGLSLFLGGCRASGPARTGGDGADGPAEGGDGASDGDDGAGRAGGGESPDRAPSNQGGQTRATGNPSGPPVASYPAFEVLNDGTSVITVQVRGPFQVSEQKAEGRIIYALSGVAVSEKVNRLPLLTHHFPTQVTSLTLEPTPGGANLMIELREPSPSTFKVVANEGGSMLTIILPRSAKFGTTNPEDDPNNFERPTSETGAGDPGEPTSGDGTPEDYEEETERRQRRSKRQARPYLWRAITLPHRTLAPDLAVSVAGYDVQDPFIFISSGVRYGIIDEVEVELTPHTIRASPRAAYAHPNLGVTAGYVGENQTFEIAGRARYFLGIDSDRGEVDGGALLLGVPMAIHLGKWGRIDTGAYATLDLGGSFDVGVDVPGSRGEFRAGLVNTHAVPFYVDSGIPFHFLFQATEVFWFGIHHGISIFDFDNASETFALPLGAEMGITAMDDFNPTADLIVRADLPQFFLPGRDGDVVEENAYQLAVSFRWFYHL